MDGCLSSVNCGSCSHSRVFLRPSGQLKHISELHCRLHGHYIWSLHLHQGHPFLSLEYNPKGQELEHTGTIQGSRRQVQVLHPFSSSCNPYLQRPIATQLTSSHQMLTELHTLQPRTTCKATIVHYIKKCLHIILHIFKALFTFITIGLTERELIHSFLIFI